VFNIQKAVSRLDYAPKRDEIKITDLTKGMGEFTPKRDKAVALNSLHETLKDAGYKLAEASLVVQGDAVREGENWYLRVPESGQRVLLRGFSGLKEGTVTLEGRWTSDGKTETLTAVETQKK